ncbi:unnamed protein product [Symbiodinium sp. CCMP2456]|nr:unnamed protein product [Symbiodinium sp. CCMP2456]
MSELEIVNVAKMTVKFATNVGYGIRTHNQDIDARATTPGEQRPPYLTTFDIVLLAGKALPPNTEEPLAFAVCSMQAYIAATHLINAYIKYNNEVEDHQKYIWTTQVYNDAQGTAHDYAKALQLASTPQSQGGMQFPEACLMWSWNQLSVEAALTKDCVMKRKAFEVWEDELNRAERPVLSILRMMIHGGTYLGETQLLRRHLHPPAYGPKRARTGDAPNETGQQGSQPSSARPWGSQQTSSSSSQQPPQAEESLVQWAEVSYPEGTTEYIFCFSKENTAICRAKLYCSVAQPEVFPAAYDETPKYIQNEEFGTTPIEHYVRRLVTYLARIQSVTQNTDYGLALKVYVELGTTDCYHGCDLHPCENLPTPAMLTVAALVNTEEDLIDPDAEREIIMPSDRERHEAEVARHRQQAIEAAKEMRSKLSVGGSPGATTIRSQPTILCTDFELYPKSGATHFPLQNEMMSKGWGQFVRFSPTISTVVNFSETQKVHVSSSVNLNAWIPLHKRRAIEEENRRVDLVRRPDVEWQNFDIALSIPEPSYSDEQRWFRIDDYSTSDITAWTTTETFFCERCEQEKSASVFCRDSTSFASGPQFPDRCTGCAYKSSLNNSFYKIKDYREMRDSETYALACARYLYVQKFQEAKPGDDLLEYIKKCCPLVYMSVGKVVFSYGGLRCPIATSVAYASWGKARQLAWDRAYDAQNNLCFIAYYDAGNAAYAGFMKTLLTPQEREHLFRGSENPAEELLGDVFELALGLLTFGSRYPLLFKAWGSPQDIDACICGIERCFHLYSAKESIKLVAARQPKKREPPTRDERVEKDVEEIIAIIRDEPLCH